MAHAAGKTAPPMPVQAAYGVFGLGAYVVFSHAAGGEFSAVLTLSVVFQCLALTLLALQVLSKRSAAGISARALSLDAAALCLRLSSTTWLNGYLPVDMTGDWIYQTFDMVSLAVVAWLLWQVFCTHRSSYQAEEDSLSASPFVLGSLLMAALLHADMNSRPLFDALWMAGLFVSVVAVLPQLWLITRSHGRCEALTSHYIAAMAVSRLLSGTFMWHARHDITCAFWVEGWNHAVWAILGAHALHLLFLADFAYYYVRAVLQDGLNCQLQLAEDSIV
uniref:ER lumen protein-retaining receptor n=1 Tax=Alexandrium andersonii TaxID=327968 RepID=A0A7S2CFI4_9DINO